MPAVLVVVGCLWGGGAVAQGDDKLVITQEPVVTGVARVGGKVTATGATWRPPGAKPHWQWQRCDRDRPKAYEPIAGATEASYTAARAD